MHKKSIDVLDNILIAFLFDFIFITKKTPSLKDVSLRLERLGGDP